MAKKLLVFPSFDGEIPYHLANELFQKQQIYFITFSFNLIYAII